MGLILTQAHVIHHWGLAPRALQSWSWKMMSRSPLAPARAWLYTPMWVPKESSSWRNQTHQLCGFLACWENIINKFPCLWFIRYLNLWLVRSLFGDWTFYLFSQTLTSIFLCLQLDPTSHLSPYSECKKIWSEPKKGPLALGRWVFRVTHIDNIYY